MDPNLHSVEECSEILRTRGWVVKELPVNNPDCPEYWRIDCASGNKSFAVLAPARKDAWNQALQAVMRANED